MNDSIPSQGPLSDVTVLDLTRVASGPFATMLLADMGADVIKIERPGQGDDSRQMDVSFHGAESGYYLGLNKNKRSVVVDLATPEGRETIMSLANGADVVVENFRPGVANRLGIGYEAIKSVRPDVIYCSITGFGAEGPRRDDIAYDIISQAMAGIMAITGEPDRPPAKCGAPVSDLSSGIFAALGIVAALHHRQRTGEGQHVGTSLLGSTAALLSSYVTSHGIGTNFGRVGSAHNTLAPYQAFAGSDGRYFILAAGSDVFFRKVASAIGRPELGTDQRYASNADRTRRRSELAELLQEIFSTKPAEHWLHAFHEADVPVSPILEIGEMIAEPQMRANGYIVDVELSGTGTLPMVMTPLTFSATPVSIRRPPPRLDEHHDEVIEIAAGWRAWRNADEPTARKS
jgi:crotonobetainyl-CoA:carnitine CoA-transferase CaiB-like acyl-CoA transferase